MFELVTFFFQFTDTGYKQENECFIYCLLNLQGNLFLLTWVKTVNTVAGREQSWHYTMSLQKHEGSPGV